MTRISEPGTQADAISAQEFTLWPEVARVETDRFCFCCGYNLHEQPVRREPRTQVFMCRCPECGTFHPVAVPHAAWSKWGERFKAVLLLSWIVFVLNLGFWVGFLHAVSVYFTLDEFTGYYDQQLRMYVRELKPLYQDQWLIVCAISAACSFGLGFLGTTMARLCFPHWRASAHRIVIYVWAVLPAIFIGLLFMTEMPNLFRWSLPYIGTYIGCYLAGGFLALLIGRRLVRIILRICVPPKWRRHLEAIQPQ